MSNASVRPKDIIVRQRSVITRQRSVITRQRSVITRQPNVIIGLDQIISNLKFFFFSIFLLLIPSFSFAQTFPPLEPYFTYESNVKDTTLSAHEMIANGLRFSEYPMVDQVKYMNAYLDLEQQVTSRSFMSKSERERAEAVLTLMYEQKLRRYQKTQTKLTTLLEDGSYNCVSASVLYSALAKAAGLTVIGNRASDHCFCSVLIDGKYIDVETTNPMGFEPGSKRQISSGSKGTAYAVVPVRQYNGRHVISDRMLVSLIARNRSAFTMDKKDYDSATGYAVARMVFLKDEMQDSTNDSRKDFDTVCTNYAAELSASGKHHDSLTWLDSVIEHWGESDDLLRYYQDAAYNTALYYCRQSMTDVAREIFNQKKERLTSTTKEEIEQMLFISSIQETVSKTVDPVQKLAFLREQKKSPLASDSQTQKQIDGQIENCHLQLIVDAANASDYLSAMDYAKAGLSELPKSTKIKNLLTQSENNYAVTVHNEFAELANGGQYQKAKKVVEEGLKLVPKNATLKNDLNRINKILAQ